MTPSFAVKGRELKPAIIHSIMRITIKIVVVLFIAVSAYATEVNEADVA